MSNPIRLAVMINSLGGGGAERVVSVLAPELARRQRSKDWEVKLVVLDHDREPYALPPGFEVVRLGGDGSYWRSLLKLRQHMADQPYDVVLSFLSRANCLNVLLKGWFGHAAVVSERGDPNRILGNGVGGRAKRLLVRALYPRADRVVAVAKALAGRLREEYGVPAERLVTIYNPVYTEQGRSESEPAAAPAFAEGSFIVAVGRLIPEKGYDLLIRAFAASDYRGDLLILGEGPERQALQQLAADCGVAERVRMPGFVKDPPSVIRRAEAFVLSSRGEGFPNALVEAMAVGCPVLATHCQFGPSEILHGVDRLDLAEPFEADGGLLVPTENVAQLTAGIDRITAPEQRAQWAQRARRRAAAFSLNATAEQYVDVLETAVAGRLVQQQGRYV